MENRYEIWNMEYEKSLWGRFTDNSSKWKISITDTVAVYKRSDEMKLVVSQQMIIHFSKEIGMLFITLG
jgi:hypothetical protein